MSEATWESASALKQDGLSDMISDYEESHWDLFYLFFLQNAFGGGGGVV